VISDHLFFADSFQCIFCLICQCVSSEVVEGEPLTSELPTVLKQKAEKLEAQPVLA
jgi:hypothetical protein